MPCRQVATYSGKYGAGKPDGGGGYKTEAECLQACKEGACCEGTTCSVKPQCQCKCTTGRCCGPDLVAVRPNELYPAYRAETREQCLARGGTWRCGSFPPMSVEGGIVGVQACAPGSGSAEPTFKGVGTTCDQLKGACCDGASCSIKTECECQGAGKTFKGVGTTCEQAKCSQLPCDVGCDLYPTTATVQVEYSGFAPIPDATEEWILARNGCPAGSGTFTANIKLYKGPEVFEGWYADEGGWSWSGDGIFSYKNADFGIYCDSTAAGFVAGFVVNPWAENWQTGNRVPEWRAAEHRGEKWNAWKAEAFLSGKKPSEVCRDICGSYVDRFTTLISTMNGPPVSGGNWAVTFTLSGCQNPLP